MYVLRAGGEVFYLFLIMLARMFCVMGQLFDGGGGGGWGSGVKGKKW